MATTPRRARRSNASTSPPATKKWEDVTIGPGALMAADGKLIVLTGKGELIIAKASPQKFDILSRAQVLTANAGPPRCSPTAASIAAIPRATWSASTRAENSRFILHPFFRVRPPFHQTRLFLVRRSHRLAQRPWHPTRNARCDPTTPPPVARCSISPARPEPQASRSTAMCSPTSARTNWKRGGRRWGLARDLSLPTIPSP